MIHDGAVCGRAELDRRSAEQGSFSTDAACKREVLGVQHTARDVLNLEFTLTGLPHHGREEWTGVWGAPGGACPQKPHRSRGGRRARRREAGRAAAVHGSVETAPGAKSTVERARTGDAAGHDSRGGGGLLPSRAQPSARGAAASQAPVWARAGGPRAGRAGGAGLGGGGLAAERVCRARDPSCGDVDATADGANRFGGLTPQRGLSNASESGASGACGAQQMLKCSRPRPLARHWRQRRLPVNFRQSAEAQPGALRR